MQPWIQRLMVNINTNNIHKMQPSEVQSICVFFLFGSLFRKFSVSFIKVGLCLNIVVVAVIVNVDVNVNVDAVGGLGLGLDCSLKFELEMSDTRMLLAMIRSC